MNYTDFPIIIIHLLHHLVNMQRLELSSLTLLLYNILFLTVCSSQTTFSFHLILDGVAKFLCISCISPACSRKAKTNLVSFIAIFPEPENYFAYRNLINICEIHELTMGNAFIIMNHSKLSLSHLSFIYQDFISWGFVLILKQSII